MITDELREYVGLGDGTVPREIRAIADRIEAEHEDQLLSARNVGYNAGFDAGYASADDWLAQHEDAMAEHGWVKLPKDADGVPIHIGDMMTVSDGTDVVEGILRDRYLVVRDGDWMTIGAIWAHHYKQPTVEDVLREFAAEFVGMANHVDDHEVTDAIETYASKLRLAGDAE